MKYNKRIEFLHSSGKMVIGNVTARPREDRKNQFHLEISSNDPFIERSYVTGAVDLERDVDDLVNNWQNAVNKELTEFESHDKELLVRLGFECLK